MHFSNLLAAPVALLILLCSLATQASGYGYFLVGEPHENTEWSNGRANLVTWRKGVLDNIPGFDIELARLSHRGLIYVARNVPETSSSLNIELIDVPPGDDYFMMILNATHGIMYSTSPRFTILPASATPTNGPQLPPDPNAPTVTVSGSPNPTQHFHTTYPPIAWPETNGALPGVAGRYGWTEEVRMRVWSMVGLMVVGVLSAVWTIC